MWTAPREAVSHFGIVSGTVFFFFPVGVEGASVHRLPAICIALALTCFGAFCATWLFPVNPTGVTEPQFRQVMDYWHARPYLALSDKFKRRYLDVPTRKRVEQLTEDAKAYRPDSADEEQVELDGWLSEIERAEGRTLFRRLALVPERGLFQVGWLSHMFLHLGWLHLVGNLFFFYLVGPMLEDRWGRPLFLGFFLASGLVAAFAHYLIDPSTSVSMVGASGAVAGCMGAFTVRFARERIRIGWAFWLVLRLWRGAFLLPAWFWGTLWFATEVFNYWRFRGETNVAVMAHIGGFAFGAAVAVALRATRLEANVLAPALEARSSWTQHGSVHAAHDALARGATAEAESHFLKAIEEEPGNLEANLGMAKLEHGKGRVADANARMEKQLHALLSRQAHEPLWQTLVEWGPFMDPALLRPAVAFRLALALEEGKAPEGVRVHAESLYAVSARAGGAMGAKALLAAARMALQRRGGERAALAHLQAASELEDLPAQWASEIEAEKQKRLSALAAAAPVALPEAVSAAPVRVSRCRIVSKSAEGLVLQTSDGRKGALPWKQILAVAVGSLSDGISGGAPVLLTDLVTSWGKGDSAASVVRLQCKHPPPEAYGQFLRELLANSGASQLSDTAKPEQQDYPQYSDEKTFVAAFYGTSTGLE